PPTSRWARVKFLVPHDYQVDIIVPVGVLEQGYFDPSGRAADRSLWHSEGGDQVLKFAKESIGFFPEEEANRLVEQNIAQIEAPIYVRPLSDYNYLFWSARQRKKDMERATYLVQRETKDVNTTATATQATIAVREEERDHLAED